MTVATYIDASALVKLVLDEPESPAVRRWFDEAEVLVTSRVGIVETRRAARRREHDPGHLEAIVRAVEVMALDDEIANAAGALHPLSLRTLDAIHLVSAMALGPELDAFVTYDDRLAEAARNLGLPVVRPA